MDRGILYITGGDNPYYELACLSAESAEQCMPGISKAIVTDQDNPAEIFDHVIYKENMKRSFADKPKFMSESPFSRTLFVDTDTYFTQPVDELWEMLDSIDLAATLAPNRLYDETIPIQIPQYNSGVILFNDSEPIGNFLSDWNAFFGNSNEHKRSGRLEDQSSFRRSIFKHGIDSNKITFLTLPTEYNTPINGHVGYLAAEAKIIHGHRENPSRRIIAQQLNQVCKTPGDNQRVYYPKRWPFNNGYRIQTKSLDSEGSIFSKFWRYLRRHGPVQTAKQTIVKLWQ